MNLEEFFKSEEWKMVEDRWVQAYDELSRIGDVQTLKELEGKKWAIKVLANFMEYLKGEMEKSAWENKTKTKSKSKSYIVTKPS